MNHLLQQFKFFIKPSDVSELITFKNSPMKNIAFLLSFIFISNILYAQSPQKFKYQAVIRNASGETITNQTVSIRISVLQGSSNGLNVYSEIHNTNTNTFGLVNIQIGGGNVVLGDFSEIDWSLSDYFIETELDETGGSSWQTMGVSQLLSVPYALYALETGTVVSVDPAIDCYTSSNNNMILRGSGNGNWECEDFLRVTSYGVAVNTDPTYSFDFRVNGSVGIGYSPDSYYELSVDGDALIEDHLSVGQSTSSSYDVDIDGDMRIQDGLGVGTSPPYSGLTVGYSSNFYVKTSLNSGSGTPLVISSGEVKKESSSLRYKEDVQKLSFIKEDVLKLQPVSFVYKASAGGDGSRDIGLIAEDVEKHIPELVIYEYAVKTNSEGIPLMNEKGEPVFTDEIRPEGVKYSRLCLYLLEIVKEQQKEIDELKKVVYEIKND